MFCHEDEEIAVVDIAHKYYVAQEVLLLVCSIIYASSFYGVTSLVLRNLVFMQGIHKRMVQFQKLTRNLFLTYTGTTHTVSSGNCPSSSCATSSSLFVLTAGPVSDMASQQEKAFCLFRFEVSGSVITVQREFRARFRKDAPCMVRLF